LSLLRYVIMFTFKALSSCLNTIVSMQTRDMSKYISKSRTKRLPITTKRAGKGFYKGKGSTKEGLVNSKGQYQPDHRLKLQLVVPDLEGFKLKPYIARTASRFAPEVRREVGRVY
jgi:large subunit ribosomal protein L41